MLGLVFLCYCPDAVLGSRDEPAVSRALGALFLRRFWDWHFDEEAADFHITFRTHFLANVAKRHFMCILLWPLCDLPATVGESEPFRCRDTERRVAGGTGGGL